MDEKFRKSSGSSSEILSPISLRRRLSAPETIMRKHMLAQQRSESLDSEAATTRSCHQWRNSGEMDAGSDTNLNRKRDSDLMRKSTLLRRLWSHSKPLTGTGRFSGTFYEWQHSYGKLSAHSLTSVHSSPEHLAKASSKRSLNGDFRTSPQHHVKSVSRVMSSPKRQVYEMTPKLSNIISPKRKISSVASSFSNHQYNDNNGNETSRTSNTLTTPNPRTSDSDTSSHKLDTSFTESTPRYNNSFTICSSTNSDSAYTNSRSNYCSDSSFNNNLNNSSTKEIHKQIIEGPEAMNRDANVSPNRNSRRDIISESIQTQTSETTNVNVISNVNLSQSTLDLIFNQVMQDVVKNDSSSIVHDDTNTKAKVINVQQVPSFFLKRKDDVIVDNPQHSRIVKYMISNVGAGSHYSAEPPPLAVPRYSALPRTSSMEVNISSGGDSTDKESDTVSLVDSLEDTTSNTTIKTEKRISRVEKPLKDNDLPLPDNSSKAKNKIPTAFFIPMESNDHGSKKAVSEHLPDKLRNKLVRRQQKREQHKQARRIGSSSRSDSNYISASDNGNNQNNFVVDNGSDINSTPLPEVNYSAKSKKRYKPLLPNIESFRRIKIDKIVYKKDNRSKSNKQRKPTSGTPANSSSSKPSNNFWIPKARNKSERLSPLNTTSSSIYDYGPRRIYHKTEFNNSNKRIEILEIMECVETPPGGEKFTQTTPKGKSKIPVLINNNVHKLPKINSPGKVVEKPTFLDSSPGVVHCDPKLDQLIANILIETLNSPGMQNRSSKDAEKSSMKNPYQQKFEAIPEEQLNQSLEENTDLKNNNLDKSSATSPPGYQGKAAVAVVRDENFASIPKGWITFYMLHKNRGSPDSTSDEGKEFLDKIVAASAKCSENEGDSRSSNNEVPCPFDALVKTATKNKAFRLTNDNLSSGTQTSDWKSPATPSSPAGRYNKKYNQRKTTRRVNKGINVNNNHIEGEPEPNRKVGDWSVTVSGTNNGGQFADLQMCLKFPDKYQCPISSQSDYSGAGEDNNNYKCRLPNMSDHHRPDRSSQNASAGAADSYIRKHLPSVSQHPQNKEAMNIQRRRDSPLRNVISSSMGSSIEPRQTQTSTRRFNLTRPKIDYHQHQQAPQHNSINFLEERQYAELLRRFPDILKITGNAINQERRH